MFTVGVDSHKRSWVAAMVDAAERPLADLAVPATQDGAAQLLTWAGQLVADSAPMQWGVEGSGSYGRLLAQRLVRTGARVYEVPPAATARERRHALGRQRQKSDPADALAVRLTLREAERLPRVVLRGEACQCKLLDEHRENLVLTRTRALNQLYAHLTHSAWERHCSAPATTAGC
jgi:transposase